MCTLSLAKLTLAISLVSVLVGCTSLFKSQNVPPLKPDSASPANFQALTAQLSDSCSAPILEPDRSRLLQEALADSQLQAVKVQLESRGFAMNAEEAQAVQLVGGEQLLIPFGDRAHLVWTRTNGQTAAVGLVRQGNKTVNITASGEERIVRVLPAQKVEKLLGKLRQKRKFQEFEGQLAQKGKRVGQVRALFDETNRVAILGLAAEGDEGKIAHQVRIRVKADKDDEPEDDAEPVIQATACGQATGEAVATSSAMQPLAAPPGEGDIGGGYEGPQICTSQWGYIYDCRKITPILKVNTTSLSMPFAIIPQQRQAAFVVWNYGGGTLRGTVTVSAPFSIVSGASFSLAPGQPQEVVVQFAPVTSGTFTQNVTISSNGGNTVVSISASAITYEEYLQLAIQAYNAMAQNGVYTALGTWDSQESRSLLIAGIPKLTRESLESIETEVDTVLDESQPIDPRLERFFNEMEVVENSQLNEWLTLLKEAIAQGRFEEEYQRLLGEGLDHVERAFMALLDTSTSEPAKQLIYNLAYNGFRAAELDQQQPSPGAPEYVRAITIFLRARISGILMLSSLLGAAELGLDLMPDEEVQKIIRYVCGPIQGVCRAINILQRFIGIVADIAQLFNLVPCTGISDCITVFENIIMLSILEIERRIGSLAAGDKFARSLYELILQIGNLSLVEFGEQLANIARMLGWMRSENMYERGFSLVVASANLAGGREWEFKGFVLAPYDYGTWWGSIVVYRPTVITIPNDPTPITNYVAVVGGDHCQDCSAKANEIVAWVQKATEEIKNNLLTRRDYFGYKGIVTFAFTRAGADVGAVLNALIAKFSNSDIPIIVSWTTSDGRVLYMCIGKASACAALGDLARMIACLQQTGFSHCNAQEVDWRQGAWEAPPPSSETPVLQLTP